MQQGNQQQGDDASPGYEVKSVDKTECVCLKTKPAIYDADSPAGCNTQSRGLGEHSRRHLADTQVGDPTSLLNVKAEQV